jgi:hypothetical protein
MTLRINGSDHAKDSDSEQQAEKHNLCSLVTEQERRQESRAPSAAASRWPSSSLRSLRLWVIAAMR